MLKRIIEVESIVILLATLIIVLMYFFIGPTITGFTVYQPSIYVWSFDNPSDYVYNNTEIEVNGDVNLKLITTTNTLTEETMSISTVTSAVYDGHDKTSIVQTLDNEKVNVNKDNIFDVTFDHNLNNNDVITLYLEGNKDSDIYLCSLSTSCSSPGHGLINYPASEGYYNITISNLDSQTNGFNIDPNDNENETEFEAESNEVKFNYVYATYKEIIEHSSENTSYPQNSEIQTKDLEISNLYKWDLLTITENLNGQSIEYYYSTDSGNTWDHITNNNLSSANTINKKIRFKSVLQSNTLNTPILNEISLNYIIQEEQQNIIYIKIINDTLTNTLLTIATTVNISDSNLGLSSNQQNLTLSDKINLKKLDLTPEQIIINNLLWATLKIYYNEEELGNINESTLKLYYYNETRLEWQELISEINTEDNYILTNLTHLSIYGIFGVEKSSNSGGNEGSPSGGGSSGGGGGSGGGGSSQGISENKKTTPATLTREISEEKPAEKTEEENKAVPRLIAGQAVLNEKNKILDFSIKNLGFLLAIFILLMVYIMIRIKRIKKQKSLNKNKSHKKR